MWQGLSFKGLMPDGHSFRERGSRAGRDMDVLSPMLICVSRNLLRQLLVNEGERKL